VLAPALLPVVTRVCASKAASVACTSSVESGLWALADCGGCCAPLVALLAFAFAPGDALARPRGSKAGAAGGPRALVAREDRLDKPERQSAGASPRPARLGFRTHLAGCFFVMGSGCAAAGLKSPSASVRQEGESVTAVAQHARFKRDTHRQAANPALNQSLRQAHLGRRGVPRVPQCHCSASKGLSVGALCNLSHPVLNQRLRCRRLPKVPPCRWLPASRAVPSQRVLPRRPRFLWTPRKCVSRCRGAC